MRNEKLYFTGYGNSPSPVPDSVSFVNHIPISINACTCRGEFLPAAIPDISKGQPLPPGMEDVIAGPCQILKTLENYDQPLIGLEFLLELNMVDLKEPRYLCLLCDKRGDPRSILVHLTSQSHYVWYLVRRYFILKSFRWRFTIIDVSSHALVSPA